MKRLIVSALFVALAATGWMCSQPPPAGPTGPISPVSGQGDYKFKVLYRSDHLPREAQAVLLNAHGGFADDRRDGKGEVYFALPGAGIIQLSADLSKATLLETAEDMKGTNLHNTTIWYDEAGTPFLTFPGNQSNRVYTTSLEGALLHTLEPPTASTDLGNDVANDYFKNGGPFIPTDTEQLNGLLYMATGYSKLDYVLTAKVSSTSPFQASWNNLSFGGKGEGVGQFGTGHGITVADGGKRIDVADRPNSEIDRFTPDGQYVDTVTLPKGSFPCDIDHLDNLSVVGALHGPDREKGAPIYILENDQVISTIMPKEELGLENFQHIHNAILHKANGKLYVIAQAWNPGDFVILEQYTE